MCLLLASCSKVPVATKPAAIELLSREQAISMALRSASMSRPEVSGALVTPQNVQAEQMTLGAAVQRLPGNPSVPVRYNPQMPVWLVTIDGLWANEVQAPGITATQAPYHHYAVVLDALTGTEIESSLKP
jgi:hypothetical protein